MDQYFSGLVKDSFFYLPHLHRQLNRRTRLFRRYSFGGLLETADFPDEGVRHLDIGAGDAPAGGTDTAAVYTRYVQQALGEDAVDSVQVDVRRVAGENPLQADARALPFADGSFDLVTAGNLLQAVEDDLPVVAEESARVLEEDGYLIGDAAFHLPFGGFHPGQWRQWLQDKYERTEGAFPPVRQRAGVRQDVYQDVLGEHFTTVETGQAWHDDGNHRPYANSVYAVARK